MKERDAAARERDAALQQLEGQLAPLQEQERQLRGAWAAQGKQIGELQSKLVGGALGPRLLPAHCCR